LLSRQTILESGLICSTGETHDHPCNTKSRGFKDGLCAGCEGLSFIKPHIIRDKNLVQVDVGVLDHTKGILVFYLASAKTFRSLGDHEALDGVLFVCITRPYTDVVSECSVPNPSLLPTDKVTTLYLTRSRHEAGCITSEIWLCKSKACNFAHIHSLRQHSCPLFFVTAIVNHALADTVMDQDKSSYRSISLG